MQSHPRLYNEDQYGKLVVSQLSSSEDMSMEAEEYPFSKAITRQQLMKT
jgi:hypothetical protein